MALSSLPAYARPDPIEPGGPRLLARADSAGATHAFAAACRARGIGYSFGFAITEETRAAISSVPAEVWQAAVEGDDLREGAWVAEITGLVDLSAWPEGSR